MVDPPAPPPHILWRGFRPGVLMRLAMMPNCAPPLVSSRGTCIVSWSVSLSAGAGRNRVHHHGAARRGDASRRGVLTKSAPAKGKGDRWGKVSQRASERMGGWVGWGLGSPSSESRVLLQGWYVVDASLCMLVWEGVFVRGMMSFFPFSQEMAGTYHQVS